MLLCGLHVIKSGIKTTIPMFNSFQTNIEIKVDVA